MTTSEETQERSCVSFLLPRHKQVHDAGVHFHCYHLINQDVARAHLKFIKIESNQKVMYIGTGEYANASTAQASYTNAINLIRASGLVRAARNRGELFLIRNDI